MKNWIEYTYPIRPDFDAKLILPSDMTGDDVERLCLFLMTLAMPPAISPEESHRRFWIEQENEEYIEDRIRD